MKTGIIYPTHGRDVTWSVVSGAWEANYPVQNLAGLDEIENVARAAGDVPMTVAGVFPTARDIGAIALIGHTLPDAASNLRIYAFSGTGNDPVVNAGTMVYDSGVLFYWPDGSAPAEDYRYIRPVLLPSTVQVRSVRIMMNPGVGRIELGGIDLGAAWVLPGLSMGRELGIVAGERDVELAGGATMPGDSVNSRTLSGQVDLISMSVTSTTGLDFQHGLQVGKPFVFAHDFEDPSTWARQCLYVRNEELPPMPGVLYRHDAFPVRFVEEMG